MTIQSADVLTRILDNMIKTFGAEGEAMYHAVFNPHTLDQDCRDNWHRNKLVDVCKHIRNRKLTDKQVAFAKSLWEQVKLSTENEKPEGVVSARWVEFVEKYTDEAEFLLENKDRNEFYKSLYRWAVSKGYLSTKQMAVIQKHMDVE